MTAAIPSTNSVTAPISMPRISMWPPVTSAVNTAETITAAPATTSSRPKINMAAGYSWWGAAYASKTSSSRAAPTLSRGWFWLPHLGDWMHEGQPSAHSQDRIASRVAVSHSSAAR